MGVVKGDTRSLDNSSSGFRVWSFHALFPVCQVPCPIALYIYIRVYVYMLPFSPPFPGTHPFWDIVGLVRNTGGGLGGTSCRVGDQKKFR